MEREAISCRAHCLLSQVDRLWEWRALFLPSRNDRVPWPKPDPVLRLVIQITFNQDLSHSSRIAAKQSFADRFATKTMSHLIQSMQKGLLGGLTVAALLNGVGIAHPSSGQHPHVLKTKSAAFLHNCGGQTPASVQSVSKGCPNRAKGLVASGSLVELLQSVQRDLPGQRGLWYQVRVVQNQASQTASSNAQTGTIGWMRANKF